YGENVYEAARHANVLEAGLLNSVRTELEAIKPMPAVFDSAYVSNLDGQNIKRAASKMELAEALIEDMQRFRAEHGCSRLVVVWCGSTEK
ncbi:inositol-3-phosphate synthase, partial [Escherichia coli]|uniref:inositol-3-phosphate synthase n=1 Tax=Escherichia coli TaxID=562 RepID=UPI0021141295